jgi:hypothetical protein
MLVVAVLLELTSLINIMALNSLNTTITANGSTAVPDWNGRLGAFLVSGTFDGATVKLEHQIGSEWVSLGVDTTVTSSGGAQFITPQDQLRVTVSGAGGSTNITVVVKPLVV